MPLTRLEQVVGTPKNHDLGSAGAGPVQLESEGLNSDLVLLSQTCYHAGWKCDMPYCLHTEMY